MSISNKLAQLQQHRIRKYANNSDSYDFFNLLTSPQLLTTVEDLLPEHRERLYPPTETLSMFLAQALNEDRSCQKAVNEAAVKRVTGGLAPVSTSTGGYCRARQRLPLSMVSELVRRTGTLIDEQVPGEWRWHGRRVHLVDGTTLTMPDTEANQAEYPQQSGQKPGLGFPICRLVGLICLSTGAVVNASMGKFKGKGADEQTLLRKMTNSFHRGDLVLGDAFYGTYFFLASLLAEGVEGVFEQMGARKRTTDFSKGIRLGTNDHVVKLSKPKRKPDWMTQEQYDSAPDTVSIRELKVSGKVIITTLLSPAEASKANLKALYKKRWQIEVDFRNIKTTLGMNILSGKTPEMNQKEIWVYLLAYNLIRLLMAQSARLADILPRQLSFKHTLQLWLAWTRQGAIAHSETGERILFALIAERQIDKRPGRIEPRAVKRRPKAYSMLTKPRRIAREEVRKNGHPKKLK